MYDRICKLQHTGHQWHVAIPVEYIKRLKLGKGDRILMSIDTAAITLTLSCTEKQELIKAERRKQEADVLKEKQRMLESEAEKYEIAKKQGEIKAQEAMEYRDARNEELERLQQKRGDWD